VRLGKTGNRSKRKNKKKETAINRREVIRYRMKRRSMGIGKRRQKIKKNEERKRGTAIGEGYEPGGMRERSCAFIPFRSETTQVAQSQSQSQSRPDSNSRRPVVRARSIVAGVRMCH
jgi:hypothetical protein